MCVSAVVVRTSGSLNCSAFFLVHFLSHSLWYTELVFTLRITRSAEYTARRDIAHAIIKENGIPGYDSQTRLRVFGCYGSVAAEQEEEIVDKSK